MSIRIALSHVTKYQYERPITLGPQTIRLRPAAHSRTPVPSYSMKIAPEKHFINWQQDPQGNYLARIVFPEKTMAFEVRVDLTADMTVVNPFDFFLEEYAEQFPFKYEDMLKKELSPFLEKKEFENIFKIYLKTIQQSKKRTIDFLVHLCQQLSKDLDYLVRMEPGVQTPEQTLEKKSGSCRDSAWLLVNLLRHQGLAARFVSGYLIQLKADMKSLDGPSGTGKDFTDLHAWAEVYLPGAGWVGLDPTSGLLTGEGHIPLVATPEPSSAAPISGSIEDCKVDMVHEMKVTRFHEDPRVTKPYTDIQWEQIQSIGRTVDASLLNDDVKLTMGGEPTFVSIDDMEGAEWTTAALGKDKLRLSEILFKRLRERREKGSLVYSSQGKWYPGEPLPRWQLGCYWRKDGKPLWKDDALLASGTKQYAFTQKDSKKFIEILAQNLSVDSQYIVPAYDLKKVSGYALPLKNESSGQAMQWKSCAWNFPTKQMDLIPGDSPIGARMPLNLLPKGDNVFWSALCLEVRAGRMHVFMPPVEKIGSYFDLISNIEKTCKTLQIPLIFEGYEPPADKKMDCFKITPDPGVIEVNVAPVKNWDELVEQTTAIYEEAHLTRLGTEKFMLDGRHSGTGGGNHVVLGGATPEESPFLRRPDLLASVIAYWHNHPSLSYLFSCLFIGPTSQAPRADEGRGDSVYELEIAMQQVDQQIQEKGQCPPWIVDRLFRHILVDGTGNTHRAELCIDKLFSPDSSTGRLGLVEFRGFEMPPHAQMSIAQQLLVRALVAKFWKTPFKEKLVRWGTTLHDRFLLPHFVSEDFKDVLSDLDQIGFEMQMDHFAPHFEFRFPMIGDVSHRGIKLELRTAIEPWYVLGEEPAGGATARFVDSSIERVQLKVQGLIDKRYIVCCNGRKVPLRGTGVEGEYVAGIRYRAWQPPSCLHPTIPVHSPLVFDVMDTWNKRTVGGCTYHVVHPGGRNYDTFPVNAFEAEARRNARFFKSGHTHDVIADLPYDEYSPDYPLTLDLRRNSARV